MAELKPVPSPPDGAMSGQQEDPFKSEFLSEASPDFEKMRRAAGDRRADAGSSPEGSKKLAPVPKSKPSVPPLGGAATRAPRPVPWGWLVLIVVAVVAAPAYVLYQNRPGGQATPPSSAVREGVTTIDSRPPGATVFIDGARRGVTPLRLSLPAGVYAVELRSGSATKTISMRVEAGESLRESIELTASPTAGRLEIASDPPGARVAIDGVPAGTTPLSVPDVPAGAHRVTVTANGNTLARTVVVQAGATASVLLSPPLVASAPTAVSGGWLTVQAPFEMQVLENGQVVGTSEAERIMLPTGRHELELRATRFGFQTTMSVDVAAGKTVTVPVSVPSGRLSINASPWADVWLDGQPVGQTPVANISVPIGAHQIVLRHPQLGERRETVIVAVDTPARIGLDMATGRLVGR